MPDLNSQTLVCNLIYERLVKKGMVVVWTDPIDGVRYGGFKIEQRIIRLCFVEGQYLIMATGRQKGEPNPSIELIQLADQLRQLSKMDKVIKGSAKSTGKDKWMSPLTCIPGVFMNPQYQLDGQAESYWYFAIVGNEKQLKTDIKTMF